jgi:CRP-like cAMP-binding protein
MAVESRVRLDARRILDLRSLPIFRDAPGPVVNGVVSLLREVSFSEGEHIQKREEIVPRVLFLQQGTVQILQPEREVELQPPAQLGLYYALGGIPSRSEVNAKTEVHALSLESSDLIDLFEDQFPLLRSTMRETARVALKETRSQLKRPFQFAGEHWTTPTKKNFDLVDRLFFLRKMLSSPSASIDALASVARQMRSHYYAAGRKIWSQGDPALDMMLIVSGTVAARTESESIVHTTGGPLGSLEVFAQAPRWYDLEAVTDVHALQTSNEAILDMIEEHGEMGSELIAGLARTVLELRRGALDIRATGGARTSLT